MRPTLRPIVLSGIALLLVAFATSGCEPEFQDDICETDEDCFPDEECIDNRCVFEEGWNECGGNEVLEHSVGDPCGPCNLDEWQCDPDDPDALKCTPGDTECPELDLVTTNATDIGERSATLHGNLQELPHDAQIVELGFCWAEGEQDPTLEDTCDHLDEVPDETGEFSLEVDGLRPGTEHFVRAYSITDVGTEDYGNEVDFLTGAPVPENVQTDSTSNEVIVTWDEVDGATGYEIRIAEDDDQVHEIDDPAQTSFEDGNAPAGSVGPPQNVEASTNDATGIFLQWEPPETVDGEDIKYEVAALYPDARSDYSDVVEGHRSPPELTGYAISPVGGDLIEFHVDSDVHDYLDDQAPFVPLTPGVISASDGTSAEYITLQFEESPQLGEAPEQSYRLRSIYGSDGDMFSEFTEEVTGERGISENFEYQWFRSPDSDPSDLSDYEEITDATQSTYEDDAPNPGEIRHYFAVVDTPESGAEETNTDSGYIATGGAVSDLEISDITADGAELTAQVGSVGDPAAEQHGFCFSTAPEPTYDDDECIELGAPDESDPQMSATLTETDVDPGTTYHVVAFIHSDSTGTAYSAESPFTTAPAQPQNLQANDGVLNWNSVDGADEYRVYRDGSPIGLTEDTTFTDEDDLTPLAPTDLWATDDDAAQITVQWQAPGSTDDVEYTVVAVIDPGADGATGQLKESVPSEPAYDDLPEPDHYQLRYQIDGADWSDWSDVQNTSYEFDDEDAAPSIAFGELSASEDNPDGIELDIDVIDNAPIEASAGPGVSFEVRSVSEANETSGDVSTSGVRDADDLQAQLTAQWQYLDADSEWQTLVAIDDINDPQYLDDGPDPEESRTYRAAAQLEGIDDTVTESATKEGTRGEAQESGSVSALQISDITADGAELSAQVDSVGDPAAEQHGFCFSTATEPSYDDDECIELGAPDENEPAMEATLTETDIDPGTTYHVVAFIHSDSTGTAYSEESPFTTAPAQPQNLQADDGVLNWSSVDGADYYQVYRDGSPIGDTTDTTFTDDDDLAPLAPTDLWATNDDAAQITVQWQAPDSTDDVEYTVVAVIDPGADGATGQLKESMPSEPAYDDLPEPDHYELRYQIDGADWSDWSDVQNTSYEFDDEDAAPSIAFGELRASEDNPDGIELDIDVIDNAPIEASAGPGISFEVRSVSEANETSGDVSTSGVRDADDLQAQLTAQWQYLDANSEWQTLVVIDDIDDPQYLDDGPDYEESRTYRAAAQLEDIDDTITHSATKDGTRGEEDSGGNGE